MRSYRCPQDKDGRNLGLETSKGLSDVVLVKRKILREAPSYKDKVYNNQWCLTSRDEVQLYKYKEKA